MAARCRLSGIYGMQCLPIRPGAPRAHRLPAAAFRPNWMKHPIVSVVIPAYNRADFLSAALQTIHDQKTPSLEVLLVDDGSTDCLESLARQHAGELRYIRQEHE